MIAPQPAVQSSRRPFLSIAQLIVSLGGGFLSLSAALLLLVVDGISQSQSGLNRMGPGEVTRLAGLLVLLAISCLPSIALSIRWLKGREPREMLSERWIVVSSVLLPVWVGALVGAAFLLKNDPSSPLLPWIDLPVIALPLFWILGFALQKIKVGSRKRFWGLVTGTFFISLPLILIVEGLILVAFVLAGSAFANTMPGFQDLISRLSAFSSGSPDQVESLINQLAPLITSPQFVFALIFGFGLLIPLVEESLKPLMLWSFANQKLTPAQGFAVGLICGASFALIESLFALNATGSTDFYAIALGRTGTGLLHTFTSGLMGWALASTWQDGLGLRLGLIYIGAVLLHGVWNTFALLLGFGSLPFQSSAGMTSLSGAVPWILGLLAVWMLTILYVMDRKLIQEDGNTLLPSELNQE